MVLHRQGYLGRVMATRLLTTAEVAAILRCSERTVQDWALAGRLHSIRPWGTKKHLFKESEVLALLRETTGTAPNNG